MPIPQSKIELLEAIDRNFSKLGAELRLVEPDKVCEKTMEGHTKGTHMSVTDLVAYLLGWNELVLKWLGRHEAGHPVDFPETGFKWNELGKLAQKFYADYQGIPYAELVTRLERAKAAIVAYVQSQSDQQLFGEPWYQRWTMGRMIQLNTSSPYDNALRRLRRWRKLNGLSGNST